MRKLTIEEASAAYNVHHTTLRRWIKSGRLSRQEAPGKHGRRLLIDEDQLRAALGQRPAEENDTLAHAEHTPGDNAPPTQDYAENRPNADAPIVELDRATAMSTYNERLIAPWVAHVSELQRTVISQAEELGSLRARLEHAEARIAELQTPRETPTPSEGAPLNEGKQQARKAKRWWEVWRRG